jgi:hypothetical protein
MAGLTNASRCVRTHRFSIQVPSLRECLQSVASRSLRQLDLENVKVRIVELKVIRVERVTVPAGVFDAFVVAVPGNGADRTTFWVAQEPRALLKIVSVIAKSPGGTITRELQK